MGAHGEPTAKTFVLVYIALLVLLGATIGLSLLELGAWSLAVALSLAAAQSGLIIAFFMRVKYQGRLVALFAIGGFLWLALLLVLSLSDYLTRA